jgi:hypothetical protein
LVEGGVERGIKKVRVHALADGRDVPDGSSVKFFGEIRDTLKRISDEKGVDACIASGGGRMKVTMDRYEVCSFSEAKTNLLMPDIQQVLWIPSSINLPYLVPVEACSRMPLLCFQVRWFHSH